MRLEGWHIIVMLGLVVALAVLVGIALLMMRARRGAGERSGTGTTPRPPGTATAPAPTGKEQRLRELDDLLGRGIIREDEHRAARQRIIDS
jgi:hypothetical protein